MADDSSQEKTEDATPKKLREARKKGQVPKSKDMSTVLELIFVFATLSFAAMFIGKAFQEMMIYAFSYGNVDLTNQSLINISRMSLLSLVKALAFPLLVGYVVAYAAGFFQVGALFATEPLMPKLEKLNMIEGLKNLFKAQTFIELAKNIIKIVAIFYLAYITLNKDLYLIVQSVRMPVHNALDITGWMMFKFMVRVLILFLVIGVADYMIQHQQFMKQMRMSKDEVKREYKQDEGDPHIKGHRKQLHREFAFGDSRQAVKSADAVVTNPVHVAVAIKYDRETMIAPEIVMSGKLAFAQNIKEIAEEFDVPIIRNVGLAWALAELEIGTEVPEDLYAAVAEILSYVYKMKEGQKNLVLPS